METSLPKGHPSQGVVSSERLSATGAFLELKVRSMAYGDNPRDRSEEEASARKGLGISEQKRNPQHRHWLLSHLTLLLP